jgi:hypothetical protein|tara:strand:- start:3475 stop:4029 length:555 start_codon:yes stop_codon:yes gene_type:complete
MSIATLKRKTQAKYNNSSVNTGEGFSLNGSYRNQGYVGQTSLSRSVHKASKNGYISTEDNSVVKNSVITNKGMIDVRFMCDPCNVVKPDSNLNSNTMGEQIERKHKQATRCTITPTDNDHSLCHNKCKKTGDFTKPYTDYLPVSSYDDYIFNRKNECIGDDIIYVPVNYNRTPLPSGESSSQHC